MESIEKIRKAAARGSTKTIAVASACDRVVLKAASEAQKQGVATPILVGDSGGITALLRELGEEPAAYEIVSATDRNDSAQKAVQLVRSGRAQILMKGLLSTSQLMHPVLNRESGLRTGGLISHLMLHELPGYPKLLGVTDGAINPAPDLAKKTAILENAAKAYQKLGYTKTIAACVCGSEEVDPRITATVDAKALGEMQEKWSQYGMQVYGPVGFDLAINKEACRHKGYTVPGGGEADLLMVPAYEVGNVLSKSFDYFACGKSAGILLGAGAPIVLVSRAAGRAAKVASMALGALLAE